MVRYTYYLMPLFYFGTGCCYSICIFRFDGFEDESVQIGQVDYIGLDGIDGINLERSEESADRLTSSTRVPRY